MVVMGLIFGKTPRDFVVIPTAFPLGQVSRLQAFRVSSFNST